MAKKQSKESLDTLYAQKKPHIEQFSFNQQVVDVFPDMINRSVPSYNNIVDGIGHIASLLCPNAPTIYDLGCSLGAVSLSIAKEISDKQPRIIGVDNSPAMLDRCRQHKEAFYFGKFITLQEADLLNYSLGACDFVALNFTLQFIAVEKRKVLIESIYRALHSGGVFILSEKIKHEHSAIDNSLVELHHRFKKENGYSDLEISQKRSALEDVMILDTIEQHKKRLNEAGFTKLTVWYQHFNFISIMAVK